MENFTPFTALAGGALIGLAAGLYMLLNGRIAGISGIIGGIIGASSTQRAERIAFTVGLVLGPVILAGVAGYHTTIVINASLPVLLLAGLLVGYGTSMGSGCTSGHGICGLARFSPRSLAATLAFMATGFLTTFVMRHLIGF